MKFVHIADMHFDTSFTQLSNSENLGNLRRLEQKKVFKKVIGYIKNNNIEYFFIAGDLYEHNYIRESTIEYINNLFKEIPNTKIFITPGNHDPYTKNSYYNKFYWSENVKIFTSKIEKIECEDCNIYGYGFDDFYCKNSGIENVNLDDKNKLNILIIHGTLDGGTIENSEYNPLSSKILKEKGFDYVALGHIHKLDYNQVENQNIVYPGSIVSLGFDELGEHGMIVGDIDKERINLKFIPLDETEFKLYDLDVTEIISKEELIEKINNTKFDDNKFYKIILVGKCSFNIDENKILDCVFYEGKIDNKARYSLDRCIEEMYKDKPFGLYKYGYIEDMKNIDEENLYEYYQKLINECKIDIFVSGIVDENTENVIKNNENIAKLGEREPQYNKTEIVAKKSEKEKDIQESMEVTQGKLIIGMDLDIDDDNLRYDVMIYNSLFGGSANSKLFQNVREKASLAYTASSSYYRFKNNIFINCGIEIPNYEKALEIIKQQIEDMKKGDFTDEEVENAKKGIIASIKTIDDEQDTEITYFFSQELSQNKCDIEQYINRIAVVNKENVIEIANKVSINTIYFLKD